KSLELLDRAAALGHGLVLTEEDRLNLRNATLAALVMPDLYPARTWDGFPPGSFNVDFDDRLEVYARTDLRGNCSVRRVEDDTEMAFLWGKGSGRSWVNLSRDARFVAVRDEDGRVRVWRLDGPTPTVVAEWEKICSVIFHPTRPEVAYTHPDG